MDCDLREVQKVVVHSLFVGRDPTSFRAAPSRRCVCSEPTGSEQDANSTGFLKHPITRLTSYELPKKRNSK